VRTRRDPVLALFLGTSHQLHDDFEECLFNVRADINETLPADASAARRGMAVLSHFLDNVAYDEATVRFGSSTLSIIHFFKRSDLMYPPRIFGDLADVHDFTVALYKVLIFTLDECPGLPRYADAPGQWACPCGGGPACGALCRGLRARLSILQVAAMVARMNNEDGVLGHVYRHIDAHSPVLCALDAAARRVWERREGPDAAVALCGDASVRALLDKHPVSLDAALTLESLPDVSPLLLLAMAYNSPSNGISAKKIFQGKFPHMAPENIARVQKLASLIFKGLPIRCYNRQLWNTIRRCCVAENSKRGVLMDRDFVSFFFKLVMASALGVYRGAEKLDDVAARMRIYSALYAAVPVAVVLEILTVDNKLALLYVMREFLLEMIARSSGILEALARTHNWDVYVRNIDVITGMVRAQMRNNVVMTPRTDPSPWRWALDLFHGVDGRIQALHNHSRGTQSEKTVNCDVYLTMKALRNFSLGTYVERMEECGEFVGREYLLTSPSPQLPEAKMALLRKLVQTFPKTHWVPLDWLVCFGVRPFDIANIEAALFHKMSTLLGQMARIREEDPDGYAVLYNFFVACRDHRKYREFMADATMYTQHAMLLHKHHGVPVDGHIPEVLFCLEVCPACNDFKRASFFPPSRRQKSTAGNNNNRVTSDNIVVCGRRHKAPDWRALLSADRARAREAAGAKRTRADYESGVEDGGDGEDNEDGDDEEAEQMRQYSAFFEGRHDNDFNPLQDMYAEVGDNDYDDDLLVPNIKGSVRVPSLKVQRRKFARLVDTQHTLRKCHCQETLRINTRGRFAVYNRVAFFSCTQCGIVIPMYLGINYGVDKLCTTCYAAAALKPPPRPVCEAACNSRNLRMGEPRRFLVYDDTDDDPAAHRLRTMTLCAHHGSLAWLNEFRGVPTATYVFRGLRERWGTHLGPNGAYIQPHAEDSDIEDAE